MNYLYIGLILGVITYLSWISYWFLYMPKRVRSFFEKSMARLFLLDVLLTVGGAIVFATVSASLTAVIAASTLGLLGTVTAICIRGCHRLKTSWKSRKPADKEIR